MNKHIERLVRLYDQQFKFLIAGVINTLFGFCVFSSIVYVGFDVWIGLLGSTIAGIFFNFMTFGGYVFRQLSASRFPKFVAAYCFVYFLNLFLIEQLLLFVPNAFYAQFILIFPMACLSYVLFAKWVFVVKQ